MKSQILMGLAAAALASTALAGAARAGDAGEPKGVVELFTSQGCNSCPPADRLFSELAARPDMIALAYHVDYWDYLGWRDTLASSDNTERQYEYGKAFGIRSVYTPQVVINGRMHVNGADRKAVVGTFEKLNSTGNGLTVSLKVSRTGDSIMIDAGPRTGFYDEAHLVLVYYDQEEPVTIERGENSGRTVTYRNAVSKVQAAGMWHGVAARFELPASEVVKAGGCAVLLQAVDRKGLPGPILGAAVLATNGAPAQ